MAKRPVSRKRSRRASKTWGREPKQVGDVLLKEIDYKGDPRVQATWGKGRDRGKKWFDGWPEADEFASGKNDRLAVTKEKVTTGKYTVGDMADEFIKECRKRTYAKSPTMTLDTFATYEADCENHIKPKFGDVLLEDMTGLAIKEWLIDKGQTFSSHSTQRLLTRINMVLDYAVEHDHLKANPWRVKKPKMPKAPYKKRVFIPDRSDLETLREYLHRPRPMAFNRFKWSCLKVIVLLGASCGLRPGEVSGLRWDSIDPVTGEIGIKEAIAARAGRKGPKTPAGYRDVPTTLRAREIIEEHARSWKQEFGKKHCVGSVVRSSRGRSRRDYLHPSMVGTWFRELMIRAGVVRPGTKKAKFSFHALRHWCASHWIKATADPHLVSKWLGHQNTSMTLDIYGHLIDDPDARAKYERMPDWLVPALEIGEEQLPPSRRLPSPEDLLPPLLEEEPLPPPPARHTGNVEVPSIAKPWVKVFVNMLAQGVSVPDAYVRIAPQVDHLQKHELKVKTVRVLVLDELKRLKLPLPRQIAASCRDEAIINMFGMDYQAPEIMDRLHVSRTQVYRVLKSRGLEPNSQYSGPRNNFAKWQAKRKAEAEAKAVYSAEPDLFEGDRTIDQRRGTIQRY